MKMVITILALSVLQFSCKKNKVEANYEPNIYISGRDSMSKPLYWLNGKKYFLQSSNFPSSMEVSEGNIYFSDGASYTKNRVKVTALGGVIDMDVVGENVYYISYENEELSYWKDNQKIKFEANLPNPSTWFIAAAENRVCVAGGIYPNGRGTSHQIFYWSEGKYGIIEKGTISDVKLDGADVYLLGKDEKGGGCYWKNGIKHQIYSINNKVVNLRDIYVKNQDVYVVGSSYDPIPPYWKNDQPAGDTLFQNIAFTSIAVYNDDVYVIGNYSTSPQDKLALLWENRKIDTIDIKASVSKIIVE